MIHEATITIKCLHILKRHLKDEVKVEKLIQMKNALASAFCESLGVNAILKVADVGAADVHQGVIQKRAKVLVHLRDQDFDTETTSHSPLTI